MLRTHVNGVNGTINWPKLLLNSCKKGSCVNTCAWMCWECDLFYQCCPCYYDKSSLNHHLEHYFEFLAVFCHVSHNSRTHIYSLLIMSLGLSKQWKKHSKYILYSIHVVYLSCSFGPASQYLQTLFGWPKKWGRFLPGEFVVAMAFTSPEIFRHQDILHLCEQQHEVLTLALRRCCAQQRQVSQAGGWVVGWWWLVANKTAAYVFSKSF